MVESSERVSHCSTDFQGFMERGAQEGARAAAEVIQSL